MDRTCDLLHAMEALSQLSYTPVKNSGQWSVNSGQWTEDRFMLTTHHWLLTYGHSPVSVLTNEGTRTGLL